MTVKQRLIEYLKYKKLSQSKFEKAINASNGYVNNITKNIGTDKLQNIICEFPDLNPDWLLSGDGEMLRLEADPLFPSEKSQDGYKLVPMYNMDARGGYGANNVLDSSEYIIDLVPFKDAKTGDICVPVTGKSMIPTYYPGTIVLLHDILGWREFIEPGNVYMIVLNDGRRLLKEIKRSKEDGENKVLLVSHNSDYEPVEIRKTLIRKVYLVTAVYHKTTM